MPAIFRRLFCVFLAVLGLLASYQAQAQYYLSLSKQTLSVPNRFIQVEQVVDGRLGKPPIGIVYRGLDNRSTVVMFRNGLENELTQFFQQQLPARPTDIPVILCLRQLRVGEILNTYTEEATADIALDIYAHLPDGYHFMQSLAAHTAERALETTSLHDNHLAQLFKQCLWQLGDERWQQLDKAPALTLAQVATDDPVLQPTAATTPAILREVPHPGVYHSFKQFLANEPDAQLNVQTEALPLRLNSHNARVLWMGVPRIRPLIRDEQGKRVETKDIWGFSDGQRVYVQHHKAFFPLTRYRNFFTFVGEAVPDIDYMKARAYAQARATVTMIAPVNAIDHTGDPIAYSLDMRTGQAGVFPNPLQVRPAYSDTTYVYVYRQADASPAPVRVSVGTQAMGELRPNEYMEIRWPHPARLLRLCLDIPGSSNCQLFIPDPAQINYLRFTTDAPTPARSVYQWMMPTQGEADLDELDRKRTGAPR